MTGKYKTKINSKILLSFQSIQVQSMGYLWFAYIEPLQFLTLFSINIHHNQPKKNLLSFLSGGTLTVSSNTRFRNGEIGQKSNIYRFHGLFFIKNYYEYRKRALIQHQTSSRDDIFGITDIQNDSPWHNPGPKTYRN